MTNINQETSAYCVYSINNNDEHKSLTREEKISTKTEFFEDERKINEENKIRFHFSREFRTQFGISIVACLLIFINGNHIGCIGPTMLKLSSNNSEIPLATDEISWLSAMLPLGAGIGPAFAGILSNRIGRKYTILLTCIPEIISWIVMAFAENIYHLCIALFIKGMVGGSAMTVIPMYLGEISSPQFRGIIGMLIPLNFVCGALFELVFVPYVSISLNAWIASVIPILLLAIFIWMPESPYYFLIKNQTENAGKSLRILQQNDSIDKQLQHLEKVVHDEQNEVRSFTEIFRVKNNRISFILCLGLMTTQLTTGLSVIVPYGQMLLAESNSPIDPSISGIMITSIGLVVAIFGFFIIESFGRRPLMLFSMFGSMIPHFLIAIYFHLDYTNYKHISSLTFLPLTALIVYQFTSQPALPHIFLSEMLSTNIKGFASLFICSYASISHSILNIFYPNLCDTIGLHNLFYCYVFTCFLSGVVIYFYLPETKGKTLEEIQKLLKNY